MSVAWILGFEGAGVEERIRRDTVPAPHALSWIMEFGGIGGSRERLCWARLGLDLRAGLLLVWVGVRC
jgi:hypothetical protein